MSGAPVIVFDVDRMELEDEIPSHYYRTAPKGSIIDLLYRAIPQEDKKRIESTRSGTKKNGGTYRGCGRRSSIVASYNNTVESEADIIAWFERAYALAAE